METYKSDLLACIACMPFENVEELNARLQENSEYKINRNEEGKIHSRYLGDRYEPAIIRTSIYGTVDHYYLFDGEIKDCIHPFHIAYNSAGKQLSVTYYSSERIENNKPIVIRLDDSYSFYNLYEIEDCLSIVLKQYGSYTTTNIEVKNYSLHEEMVESFKFNFAD